MRAMIPGPKFRSPTALQGKSDLRDEILYSAIVAAHGGSSSVRAFTTPWGGTIPALKAASITVAESHHLQHSDLTTNLVKAGEIGSQLGECAIRGIGLVIEAAAPAVSAGAFTGDYGTWGATPVEVAEILGKLSFELKISGKTYSKGPFWNYPAPGGVSGGLSLSQTKNDAVQVAGFAQNGPMLSSRRLKYPIQAARTDTVEGVFQPGNGATLAFKTTTGGGQETLITAVLNVLVAGDVR